MKRSPSPSNSKQVDGYKKVEKKNPRYVKVGDSRSQIGQSLIGSTSDKKSVPKTKRSTGGDDVDDGGSGSHPSGDYAEVFSVALLERDEDIRYGWCRFTPDCIQWCCSPEFLLLVLMLIAIAQGFFVHGILSSSWSALNGRFHFNMVELGLIRMMYDVGMVVGFFPIIYFDVMAAKRSVWLGISCLLMSIGAFTCTLPHFLIGRYELDIDHDLTCHSHGMQSNATTSSLINDSTFGNATKMIHHSKSCLIATNLNYFKFVFMLGVFLNGLGGAGYFSMGMAFLDESVSQRSSVTYSGVLSAALLLGTMLALITNAYVLSRVYVDVNVVGFSSRVKLAAENPHWRGAWWLGMLLASALSLKPAFLMFGFPRQLPGVARVHLSQMSERDSGENEDKAQASAVHTPWKSMKACLCNMTYLGLTLEQTMCWVVITSASSFMPAFLRTVYGASGVTARLMSATIIFFGMLGSLMGTFIQHRLTFGIMGNLRFSLAAAMATIVCLVGIFFVACDNTEFAGKTVAYPVEGGSYEVRDLYAPCNQPCKDHCSKEDAHLFCYRSLDPVNKRTTIFKYFSPCFAGCSKASETGGVNCSCVPEKSGSLKGGGEITAKACKSRTCKYRGLASVVLFSWCAFLMFTRLVPVQISLFQCIPIKDRFVGLAIAALVARMFGALPSAPIMGVVLKDSCRVNEEICGADKETKEKCIWRDDYLVRFNLGIAVIAIFSLGLIGLSVAYFDQTNRRLLNVQKTIATSRRKKLRKD